MLFQVNKYIVYTCLNIFQCFIGLLEFCVQRMLPFASGYCIRREVLNNKFGVIFSLMLLACFLCSHRCGFGSWRQSQGIGPLWAKHWYLWTSCVETVTGKALWVLSSTLYWNKKLGAAPAGEHESLAIFVPDRRFRMGVILSMAI